LKTINLGVEVVMALTLTSWAMLGKSLTLWASLVFNETPTLVISTGAFIQTFSHSGLRVMVLFQWRAVEMEREGWLQD
jgi:hypothetical protein